MHNIKAAKQLAAWLIVIKKANKFLSGCHSILFFIFFAEDNVHTVPHIAWRVREYVNTLRIRLLLSQMYSIVSDGIRAPEINSVTSFCFYTRNTETVKAPTSLCHMEN